MSLKEGNGLELSARMAVERSHIAKAYHPMRSVPKKGKIDIGQNCENRILLTGRVTTGREANG